MEDMDCVNTWQEEAKAMQQAFYLDFGDRDWDRYEVNERHLLLRNIGFAICGQPDEEPDEAKNLGTGYSSQKLKHVEKLCEKLQLQDNQDGKIDIGIIYIIINVDVDNPHVALPVFRIPKGKQNVFIDSSPDGRLYVGWENYLRNNQLPKGFYCYPQYGVYYGDGDDQVIVDFSKTPACKLSRRLLTGIDNVGTVVSIGATILSVAALATPVASSVLLAAAVSEVAVGVYSMGRSVNSIVDRKRHQQSIGVKDAESRSAYIAMGASILGMASAGASRATATLASRGRMLSRTELVIVNAAKVSSITANGIGIVNTVLQIKTKLKTGETVTNLEIFQLSSAVLFFMQSVVSFKTAKNIVKETQQDVINSFELQLNSERDRKGFKRAVRNTREGLDAMNGDAKIIRSLKNVENSDNFFSGINRVESQPGHADLRRTSGGIKLQDIAVNGVRLFGNLRLVDEQRVRGMMRRCCSPEVVCTAARIAYRLGFTQAQVTEFIQFLDFASVRIDEILIDMLNMFKRGLNALTDARLSENERKQKYLDIIYDLYSIGEKSVHLLSDFKRYKESLHQASLPEQQPSSLSSGCNKLQEWNDPSPHMEQTMTRTWDQLTESDSRDILHGHQINSGKRHKSCNDVSESQEPLCLDRDFAQSGLLSLDELYIIAAMATGRDANKYNSAIDLLEDVVATVVVMAPNENDCVVLVTSDISKNVFTVQLLD